MHYFLQFIPPIIQFILQIFAQDLSQLLSTILPITFGHLRVILITLELELSIWLI
jgi:hypothetical protein